MRKLLQNRSSIGAPALLRQTRRDPIKVSAQITEQKSSAKSKPAAAAATPKAKTTDEIFNVVNKVSTVLDTLTSAGAVGAPQRAVAAAPQPSGFNWTIGAAVAGGLALVWWFFLRK